MSIPAGRPFYKMSGSGNHFVFFDARTDASLLLELADPASIRDLCAAGTGIGADGVVFLQRDDTQSFSIRYFNRDGSLGELCGNASLCSVRLAQELGVFAGGECTFRTDAGVMTGRFRRGRPEVDLPAVQRLTPTVGFDLAPGERRMGFADTGVPHLVVLVDDAEKVDVVGRGRPLRLDRRLASGANVNFVMPSGPGAFAIRTYERGVEAETLACGTGSVASAVMLEAWGLAGRESSLRTRSGLDLVVRLRHSDDVIWPTLGGEARVVFRGEIAELQQSSE